MSTLSLTVLLEERWRQFGQSPADVGPQALRGLVGDLDAVLQDGHGEVLGGHGAEEEAVVVVDLVGCLRQVLHQPLHGQHPRLGQVAVL